MCFKNFLTSSVLMVFAALTFNIHIKAVSSLSSAHTEKQNCQGRSKKREHLSKDLKEVSDQVRWASGARVLNAKVESLSS